MATVNVKYSTAGPFAEIIAEQGKRKQARVTICMQRDQACAASDGVFGATVVAKYNSDLAVLSAGVAYLKSADEEFKATRDADEYNRKLDIAPSEAKAVIDLNRQFAADCKAQRQVVREIKKPYDEQEMKTLTFKNQIFTDRPASEFSGTVIWRSNFSQRVPFTKVFPAGTRDLELYECVCENVDLSYIPGLKLTGRVLPTKNEQVAEQNDGELWIVNDKLEPVSPRDWKRFDKCGLSKDPRDIPEVKLAEPITVTQDPKRIEETALEALRNDPERLKAALAAEKAGA